MSSHKEPSAQQALDTFNAPFKNILSTTLGPICAIAAKNQSSETSFEDMLPGISEHLSKITQAL